MWLGIRTEQHVELLWPHIENFAKELPIRKEMSGREATEMIQRLLRP